MRLWITACDIGVKTEYGSAHEVSKLTVVDIGGELSIDPGILLLWRVGVAKTIGKHIYCIKSRPSPTKISDSILHFFARLVLCRGHKTISTIFFLLL